MYLVQLLDNEQPCDNFLPSCLHLIGRIQLSRSYQNIRTEPKYKVFLLKLLLLFQFCHVCRTGRKPEMKAEQTGFGIVIKTVCTNSSCRKEFIWSSQPLIPGTKLLVGNFLISMAVLFAGGFFTKARQIFLHMSLACISLSTFFRHQWVSDHCEREKKLILSRVSKQSGIMPAGASLTSRFATTCFSFFQSVLLSFRDFWQWNNIFQMLFSLSQICPGLSANKIQIAYHKNHKVSLLVKSRENTHNSIKLEAIWKCQKTLPNPKY